MQFKPERIVLDILAKLSVDDITHMSKDVPPEQRGATRAEP